MGGPPFAVSCLLKPTELCGPGRGVARGLELSDVVTALRARHHFYWTPALLRRSVSQSHCRGTVSVALLVGEAGMTPRLGVAWTQVEPLPRYQTSARRSA